MITGKYEAKTVVAGLQYYDLADVSEALQQGIRLRPDRDPENRHDKNAIRLWLDRAEAEKWEIIDLIKTDEHRKCWMLGHIPRGDASVLAPLIDGGMTLDVYVSGGERDGAWSVEVRMEGTAIDEVIKRENKAMVTAKERKRRWKVLKSAEEGADLVYEMTGDVGWKETAAFFARESFDPCPDRAMGTWEIDGQYPDDDTRKPFWGGREYETALSVYENLFGIRHEIEFESLDDLMKELENGLYSLDRIRLQCETASRKRRWKGLEKEFRFAEIALSGAIRSVEEILKQDKKGR